MEPTPELVATVEALVSQVDAIRARTDLSDAEKAEQIKAVEAEISKVRGGVKWTHRGVGIVRPL